MRTAKAGRQGLNRRLQAEDIKNVYDNHLKNNKTLKKELELRANQTIKFDVSNKRDNVLGQVLNIKQIINNDLPRALNDDALNHKLLKNHTDRFVDILIYTNQFLLGLMDHLNIEIFYFVHDLLFF